jgi:hypothetical protein
MGHIIWSVVALLGSQEGMLTQWSACNCLVRCGTGILVQAIGAPD